MDADTIISQIIEDIRDRRGIGDEWENIDVDVRNEIVAQWRQFFPAPETEDKRDAERYRWLRVPSRGVYWRTATHGLSQGTYEGEYLWGDDLDSAIDAARAKGGK